jgi:hypothetical protein
MENEIKDEGTTFYDIVKFFGLMNRRKIGPQVYKDMVKWMIRGQRQNPKYKEDRELLLVDIKRVVSDFRDEILFVVDGLMEEEWKVKNEKEIPSLTEDRNLTVQELSEFCGGVSRPTIDKWKKEGLKFYKINGRVLFKLSVVKEFLSNYQSK